MKTKLIGQIVIGVLGVVSLAGCFSAALKDQMNIVPLYFDAGSGALSGKEAAFNVPASLVYDPILGFGWTSETPAEFFHDEWTASRTDFSIDGVQAPEIGWKSLLPDGKWWLTIWLDGGLEDSSTVSLSINGASEPVEFQYFLPHAEHGGLRPAPQKMYRIVQRLVDVSEGELSFQITGGRDEARLLGFSIIPDESAPANEDQEQVYEQLKQFMHYQDGYPIEEVLQSVEALSGNPANRNFKAYWKQQLEILQEAEMYFYYRGWSWATDRTGLSLFDHLHQSVMLFDAILNQPNASDNPLYERALWYRGRLLYWLWLERGGPGEGSNAKRDLTAMYQLYPENELVRMYNGEKIDNPDPFDNAEQGNAPDWAFYQWELSNRLKSVADWWVLEQQSENGEFGGKFGDDVEILRWWSPLILSGDETAYIGWKKLADGVWNSSRIKDGYAKNPSDVEHSSEFISDTAPLMVFFTDEKEYIERLKYSSDHFQNLWTGYNNNGDRFFKSAWFSSSEVEMEPPKNRDVAYNARATKAVRYYHWKTSDPSTRKALIEWADAWIGVSEDTQKGKPEWIVPPSVEFPSGVINGDEPTWYHANMFWDYFNWKGSAAILDQLLYTWTFTADAKYLEPIIQHLELVSRYKNQIYQSDNMSEKGSEPWAAYIIGNSSNFWNVVESWRLLTHDETYDELILKHGTPFIKYRITGNEQFLLDAMTPYLETVRYNEPMISTEAIHTDRVFITEPRGRQAGILQGMITGFGVDESASPYIAVNWEKASRDLTFLVNDSDSSSLELQIYSFSDEQEEVTMRIWQLEEGTYMLRKNSGGKVYEEEIEIEKRGQRFILTIESKQLVNIRINPVTQ
ncbi:MAG: hypothetical protein MI700_00535 [Balneolales bacterium]|nr:hypothetical protein [Balneolales bacterium]